MNILIVSDIVPNPKVGGIENVSLNLALEFQNSANNVYFLSSSDVSKEGSYRKEIYPKQYYISNEDGEFSEENIEYVRLLLEKLSIDIVLNQSAHIPYYVNLFYNIKQRCNLVNTKVISVLHINPTNRINDIEDFYFDRKKLGLNLFKWVTAIIRFVFYKLYIIKRIRNKEGMIYRDSYSKSDAYLLLSDKFKDSFISLAKIIDSSKLYAINNPVKKTNLDVKITDKEKVILYVGRLVRSQKRVDRLLDVWQRIYRDYPDWKLVIVGEGNCRLSLEEFVDKNRIERVEFKGRQNPIEYYKTASIFTMVSTFEGLPLVLAEAQQAGCIPMAYSSFESVTDIIDEGEDGVLVTPFSSKEYERKLRQLMDDENLREIMINNCLNKDYSQFDVQNVAKQWIEFFEKMRG